MVMEGRVSGKQGNKRGGVLEGCRGETMMKTKGQRMGIQELRLNKKGIE